MKIKTLSMIILFCLTIISGSVYAEDFDPDSAGTEKDYSPYPQPDRGYVTDIGGVLSYEEEERIESWLYTAEVDTNVEIVVVIINSIKDYPGTSNSSIETFATGLFDTYKIGNMPENNGVLLVVALKDRKARIELGAGYGRSSNVASRKIMDRKIIPYFRKDQYSKGVMSGTKALLSEFAGLRIIPGWVKIAIPILIIILIFVCISLFKSGKRGWGWVCVGLIIVLLLALLFVAKKTCQALPAAAGAGGHGGGFGGGFSGGGGASGGW